MSFFSTVTGLAIPSWSTLFTSFKTRFKAAFGDEIRVDDPDGVYGRLARIFCEMKNDVLADFSATMNALLPSTSTGAFLDEMVKFNGITRNVASNTTCFVRCYANTYGTTIPATGALIGTPDGNFELDGAPTVIAPSGNALIAATAVEEGDVFASVGPVDILTPIRGWESAEIEGTIVIGDAIESDPALRTRRWEAARAVGIHHPSMIKKVLSDLDDVTEVFVEVNKGTTTNSNGVPPGCVRAITIGGDDQDIADTLFGIHPLGDMYPPGAGSVAAGIGTYGLQSQVATDTETGQSDTMYWDDGVEIPVYVVVNTRISSSSFPLNGADQIAEAIEAFSEGDLEIDDVSVDPFHLGDDVVASRLYTPCNKVIGHSVESIYIGRTADPTSSADVVMGNHEKPTFSAANVTVNGV